MIIFTTQSAACRASALLRSSRCYRLAHLGVGWDFHRSRAKSTVSTIFALFLLLFAYGIGKNEMDVGTAAVAATGGDCGAKEDAPAAPPFCQERKLGSDRGC